MLKKKFFLSVNIEPVSPQETDDYHVVFLRSFDGHGGWRGPGYDGGKAGIETFFDYLAGNPAAEQQVVTGEIDLL